VYGGGEDAGCSGMKRGVVAARGVLGRAGAEAGGVERRAVGVVGRTIRAELEARGVVKRAVGELIVTSLVCGADLTGGRAEGVDGANITMGDGVGAGRNEVFEMGVDGCDGVARPCMNVALTSAKVGIGVPLTRLSALRELEIMRDKAGRLTECMARPRHVGLAKHHPDTHRPFLEWWHVREVCADASESSYQ
jgi:hypothetical protein